WAHRGSVAGLSIPTAVRFGRIADAAVGAQFRRGAAQRFAYATGSALSLQCAQHHIGPGRAGAEAGAEDDRASGGLAAALAHVANPASGSVGGGVGLSGSLPGDPENQVW